MRRRQRRPSVAPTPEAIEAIRRMAPDHWLYEIAVELKISVASVSKWARRHGIPTRSRREAMGRFLQERGGLGERRCRARRLIVRQ